MAECKLIYSLFLFFMVFSLNICFFSLAKYITYKVTTKISDKKNLEGKCDIYLTIFGSSGQTSNIKLDFDLVDKTSHEREAQDIDVGHVR